MRRPTLAVIGAGPAGLMAAEVAARAGAAVTVYDRMASPARKFLLAGRGGLNITHGEDAAAFPPRYGPAGEALRGALEGFSPGDLRAWCAALGEPTFVGSSGRVFPHSFKTSPLLRAWLRRLDEAGVSFRFRQAWEGWTAEGGLRFTGPEGPSEVTARAVLLALGGASWPHLGADGAWVGALRAQGLAVAPLRPGNCGFRVDWSDTMRERFAGQPLKHIALRFGERQATGEAVITRQGLEGGGVYALAPVLREAIAAEGEAVLRVALRPDLDAATVAAKLAAQPRKASLATMLRKALGLSPAAVALVQEARHRVEGPLPALPTLVNAVPVRLIEPMGLDRAISTAGGLRLIELDSDYMLRARPGVFAAGEMLDWEAPTGGYLLQACFATGAAAGRGAARWLGLVDPSA